MSKIIDGYECVNSEKLDRAINGSVGKEGRLYGGVGEDASDMVKLATYDKIGGLIRKDGKKVKMGSFFDFEKKVVREKPEIVFVFSDVEGNVVEIAEGDDVPIEVQAAEKIKEKKVEKAKEEYKEEEIKKVEQKLPENFERRTR